MRALLPQLQRRKDALKAGWQAQCDALKARREAALAAKAQVGLCVACCLGRGRWGARRGNGGEGGGATWQQAA